MIAILINCITLGSYQPCYDTRCESNRCQWLKTFDNVIFLFFFMEMLIKMIAMGVTNAPQAYLADYWNRLDCFIVIAGGFEYILDIGNVNLTAIRTVRVLRPLRAINRIPSMRILVTLLLDTLPMLGNVLLLCFFVFFIFGIIGVQLWSGLLRQRCFISLPTNMTKPSYVPPYYRLPTSDKEYLCSTNKDNGLHKCQDLPPLRSTDLSTLCQNSLPMDWQPPKPTVVVTTFGNETRQRFEDRFIDGELIPYDLVPGDESSPFLVKQMSPLIAQSVFQPAYAPNQFDSLPSLRQKRETSTASKTNNNNNTLKSRGSKSISINDDLHNSSPSSINNQLIFDKSYSSSKASSSQRQKQQQQQQGSRSHSLWDTQNHYNETIQRQQNIGASRDRYKTINDTERIRLVRLANNNRMSKKFTNRKLSSSSSSSYLQEENDDTMVETNANSDQFDSISQTELIKSDKSSRKYYLRKKTNKGACINWNKYYTDCRSGDTNPFQGTISFDNVGMAWTTIFLVISLEGWSDIMYLLQDSHSFWVWIYFVLLIVIGSFFMINLCLVVIATQFSATKKREMERMRQERMKFSSTSTLTAASESTNCYTVIVKSIARCLRHAKIYFITALKRRKCNRLHKQRLRARQQHAASHQVTGIHTNRNPLESINDNYKQTTKRLHKSTHKTSSSSPPSATAAAAKLRNRTTNESTVLTEPEASLTVATVSSGKVNALSRRNSWKQSSKPSLPQGDGGQHHSRQLARGCSDKDENQPQQVHPSMQDDAAAEHLHRHQLISKQISMPAAVGSQATTEATNIISTPAERHLKRMASTKRSIRLGTSTCGPNCSMVASSSNRSSGKRLHRGHHHNHHQTDLSRSCSCYNNNHHHHHNQDYEIENIEISFCPKFITKNTKFKQYKRKFNQEIKHLVDHRYFQRLILLAILINAISMGIEYHNQPEQLTEAVEISNIVFACLFLVEMVLKLIAHGLYDYVIDGFNCFDGCIVILSILELFESSSGSGLSVLRTFRLLRILKLVRFMPALRRQLVIMLRTLDNVAVFFALLVLFIFIFSILGMNLFGCKFCETLPDGTERCDRKNFNSLLWSLVTVFQILTQEDWNVVLFNGMEKTSHWAALYFVLLMTFGNYVLFNLLVAILVEGFSQEDDFKVSASSSYTINNGTSKDKISKIGGGGVGAGAGSGGGKGSGGQLKQLTNRANYYPDASSPSQHLALEHSHSTLSANQLPPSRGTTVYDYSLTNRSIENCDDQFSMKHRMKTLEESSDFKRSMQDDDGDNGSCDLTSQLSPTEGVMNEEVALRGRIDVAEKYYRQQDYSSTRDSAAAGQQHLFEMQRNEDVVENSNNYYYTKRDESTQISGFIGVEESVVTTEAANSQEQAISLDSNNIQQQRNLNDFNGQPLLLLQQQQQHGTLHGGDKTNNGISAFVGTMKSAEEEDKAKETAAFVTNKSFIPKGLLAESICSQTQLVMGGKEGAAINASSAITRACNLTNAPMQSIQPTSGSSSSSSSSSVDYKQQLAGNSTQLDGNVSQVVLECGGFGGNGANTISNSASPPPSQTLPSTKLESASLVALMPSIPHSSATEIDIMAVRRKTKGCFPKLQQQQQTNESQNNYGLSGSSSSRHNASEEEEEEDRVERIASSSSNSNDGDKLVNLFAATTTEGKSSQIAVRETTTCASAAAATTTTGSSSLAGEFYGTESVGAMNNSPNGHGTATTTTTMTMTTTTSTTSGGGQRSFHGDSGVDDSGTGQDTMDRKPPDGSYYFNGQRQQQQQQKTSGGSCSPPAHNQEGSKGSKAAIAGKESRQSHSQVVLDNSTSTVNSIYNREPSFSSLSIENLNVGCSTTTTAAADGGQPITYAAHNQQQQQVEGAHPLHHDHHDHHTNTITSARRSNSHKKTTTTTTNQLKPNNKYWNYGQLVTSAVEQPCLGTAVTAPVNESANDQSLAFFGIRRPPKRLVYFYDINDDVDDEIDFLTKSLETKSYATSMMGQHDHYLDNIAKNQAAAARMKAANKLQAQYRINMCSRAQEQEQQLHRSRLLAAATAVAQPEVVTAASAAVIGRSNSLIVDSKTTKQPGDGSDICEISAKQGAQQQQQAPLPPSSTSNRHQHHRPLKPRVPNVELVLGPHWSSLPSHLNRAGITMMRFYQSSLTSNFYMGKKERVLLQERGQFDKSCCRVDYSSYARALQAFGPIDGSMGEKIPFSMRYKSNQQQNLLNLRESSLEKGEKNIPEEDDRDDINLGVIYEPFRMFPMMANNLNNDTNQQQQQQQQNKSNSSKKVAAYGQMATLLANHWQRGLLKSLEDYAIAIARYEDRLAMRKQRVQENALLAAAASNCSASTSNLNRTTQALRRGSVCVLSKLKLIHAQNMIDSSPAATAATAMAANANTTTTTTTMASSSTQALMTSARDNHLSGNNSSTQFKSVPRLSLTRAIEPMNESQEMSSINGAATTNNNNNNNNSNSSNNIDRNSNRSRGDVSDIAIQMSASNESLACATTSIGGHQLTKSNDLTQGGFCSSSSQQTALNSIAELSHIKMTHLGDQQQQQEQPLPQAMVNYSRHSIANLPLTRSQAAVATAASNTIAEKLGGSISGCASPCQSNVLDDPLIRPASYTPNLAKRSLPRPSLIGWFNIRGSQTSCDCTVGNRNSCFSQTSRNTSILTDNCGKIFRPNLRRRRSFSGPFEWLKHEYHRPPYDMMLSPVKKQTNKKRLKKMKPQKSNSSDYHSLNNRRVYKLDSRGFQTKLKGVFYVITHDPLIINALPPNADQHCRQDLMNSSYIDNQQQLQDKDVISNNEMESSFFNTSNDSDNRSQSRDTTGRSTASRNHPHKRTFLVYFHWTQWMIQRRHYSLFIFSPRSRIRRFCLAITSRKEFDYFVLFFISMNCVTLAMERPKIPPWSKEREFLTVANYYFTFMFTLEMALKVIAKGLYYGKDAYLSDSWNVMDGSLVGFSLFDLLLSIVADRSPRIFAILRVFRLLRSLRPLRVINRLMGLKLVVQTLLLSLRPIGNIVLICCTFFIIFGILGVQLFKGTFYYCDGPDPLEIMRSVRTKEDCMVDHRNRWINRKYNFDNLGQALMALFVLSSKDGWVNIMYTGLDAVGVDMQPRENYNEWRLIYFISFLLLVAFFVLNMFVGVVVENFHRCRKEQELEEKARRAEKRQRKLDKRRRKLREPPYYSNYGKFRLLLHKWVTGGYFDLLIAAVIGFNVVFMSLEHYQMPYELIHLLKVSNYVFTAAFILEAVIKSTALGMRRYLKDRWNQLDVMIVAMSIIGIIFEEMDSFTLPINPTLLRVLRVMRIARVLKLLKMAKGIRALLDTVMQALPQVGNLGLLFFLLFFIFAALGVELFGRLECNDEYPCSGLMDQHAHFQNFGLAFLTLFRVATGDNWNGIMKDTLRDKCDPSSNCLKNCCVSQIIAPLYFVVFVLLAQFVLVNVVVAVLMKHLEESHHEMEIDEEYELDKQLAEELEAKKRALLEARERQNLHWI